MKKYLSIIPARAGSKRLPNKNIKSLLDKPLIAWTIEAALKCDLLNRVIVSTESQDIADIALSYGADVPFLRPSHLATDEATSIDVVLDLVQTLKERDQEYENIILLQPTSPFRTDLHICDALNYLEKSKAPCLVSVCETECPKEWVGSLLPDGRMDGFRKNTDNNMRSQDLEKSYRINGAIYAVRTDYLIEQRTFIPDEGYLAFIMNRNVSLDIDDEFDFEIATFLAQKGEANQL